MKIWLVQRIMGVGMDEVSVIVGAYANREAAVLALEKDRFGFSSKSMEKARRILGITVVNRIIVDLEVEE